MGERLTLIPVFNLLAEINFPLSINPNKRIILFNLLAFVFAMENDSNYNFLIFNNNLLINDRNVHETAQSIALGFDVLGIIEKRMGGDGHQARFHAIAMTDIKTELTSGFGGGASVIRGVTDWK